MRKEEDKYLRNDDDDGKMGKTAKKQKIKENRVPNTHYEEKEEEEGNQEELE